MTYLIHLAQMLNRLKVSCMTVFDPLMQFLEEARARHFPNPMSMALIDMKMPTTGKLVWQRLRVLRKIQSTTA